MFDNVIDKVQTHDEVRLSHHFLSTINFDQTEHGLNKNDLIALLTSLVFVILLGLAKFIRYK